jgi:c-di-GMP-binding flagellar brake protein YcgR
MPYTIGGALRQKKLFVGKQVSLLDHNTDTEISGKVVAAGGDSLSLELMAPPGYGGESRWQNRALSVQFLVPGDATYSFPASVSRYDQQSRLLQLEQVARMTRRDQRNDFRLKTAKLIYVTQRPGGDGEREKWQQASLLDISRGGANILSKLEVSVGDLLKAWIPLEEVDHVIETGIQVMRIVEREEGMVMLGVSFSSLTLPDQEKILDYILKVWTEKKDEKTTTT